MKLQYYPDTDSLYVELKPIPGVETREVSDGLIVDLDADGQVVGFDMKMNGTHTDHCAGGCPLPQSLRQT